LFLAFWPNFLVLLFNREKEEEEEEDSGVEKMQYTCKPVIICLISDTFDFPHNNK